MKTKLTSIFSELEDPRRDLGKQHKLDDILLIGIIAVICGAETWNNIEEYAHAKKPFLLKFLELPNGSIPSHDTFNRVFSCNDSEQSPFHIVSAWASENNMVLGQVKTDEKSNEITAIPKLLEILTIEGSLISIDAMGCQQDIATKIIDKRADYLLAVKENQKQLHQDIMDEFRFAKNLEVHTTIDGDHGRIETRKCSVITHFDHIKNQEKWKGL